MMMIYFTHNASIKLGKVESIEEVGVDQEKKVVGIEEQNAEQESIEKVVEGVEVGNVGEAGVVEEGIEVESVFEGSIKEESVEEKGIEQKGVEAEMSEKEV